MNAMTPKVCIAKYPMYKDSGWDWLGKIPSHWEITTIGALVEIKCDRNHPDYEVLSVYREYGVIPKDSRDDNHNATSLDTTSYKAVTPGDLVINKMKAWQGSMGVSGYKGIVSPAYITCKIYTLKVWPPFFHYLLRCSTYIGEYNKISYGVRVGQWDMHYEDFKRIGLAIPSITEQKAIAEFINTKTALIDKAISIKERQIELLKERRDALINKAVTKGLNPNVKMKDSGVEWIGEIPKHWEVRKLKTIAKKITDGEHLSPIFTDYGMPFLSAKDVRDGYVEFPDNKFVSKRNGAKFRQRCDPEKGDILLVSRGATIGRVAIVTTDKEFCLLGSVILIKPHTPINRSYLLKSLQNKLLQTYLLNTSHFSAQQAIYLVKVVDLKICIPPIKEQIKIAEFTDLFDNKLKNTVSKIEQEIEKLKEYKSSLINSAVTGKIKVC